MLASVASGFAVDPAKVCCPSIGIRFSDEVDVHRIAARGNMWPIINGEPKNRTTYPWGHKFDIDQQAVSDCALSATMLSGAVENSLKGIPAKCNYECDTEFGCDYCIPKGIVAAPAESREMIKVPLTCSSIGLPTRAVPKILFLKGNCLMTMCTTHPIQFE
jgi:hypothetical protein